MSALTAAQRWTEVTAMAEHIKQKIQGGKKSICDSCAHRNVCKAIDNQPCTECNHYQCTADVEPVKHGQWIYNIESGEYLCSACGENALSFRKDTLYGLDLYETCLTDYCPNCGAKMDEEAKHER